MTYSQEPKFREIGRCAVEGCVRRGATLDHCLHGQKKGKRVSVAMRQWLHSHYNTQPCCVEHNDNRVANNYESRKAHLQRIFEREGWPGVAEWHSNCPSEKYKLRDDYQEVCRIIEDYARESPGC